ncbi:MAG: hypothetical protein V4760_13070 [Bdellovibrionota bacterium]
MRDYIFSLTLLTIFLGAYTALVLGLSKPIDSRARSAQANEAAPREPALQIAEPSDIEN